MEAVDNAKHLRAFYLAMSAIMAKLVPAADEHPAIGVPTRTLHTSGRRHTKLALAPIPSSHKIIRAGLPQVQPCTKIRVSDFIAPVMGQDT